MCNIQQTHLLRNTISQLSLYKIKFLHPQLTHLVVYLHPEVGSSKYYNKEYLEGEVRNDARGEYISQR